MRGQISLFDGSKKFVINKPIRLVEFFAGYGSQSLALKYLGIPFTHHIISEWAVPSIKAYKDLHFSSDNTDYSEGLSNEEVLDFLDGRISADYSNPMKREQIIKKGEKWQRQVFNEMTASYNLGSIMKIKGGDLDITETDKYCYMLTYSFP